MPTRAAESGTEAVKLIIKKLKIKKMIRTKITAAVLVLLLSAASCNYLDVVPSNIAVIEDAFKTRDNAERFLGTLYGYLPRYTSSLGNPALFGGDEMVFSRDYARSDNPVMALKRGGQNVNTPIFGYWGSSSVQNLFVALRDCNIFLNNLDKPFADAHVRPHTDYQRKCRGKRRGGSGKGSTPAGG